MIEMCVRVCRLTSYIHRLRTGGEVINLFTGCYSLLMQCRQCNVKIECEQLPRCIEQFNIWFLEPWSNYYFLGCDKAKSITHGAENSSTHIVTRCFCRNFAHKTMMSEGVAEIVVNSTIMIFNKQGYILRLPPSLRPALISVQKNICSRDAEFL